MSVFVCLVQVLSLFHKSEFLCLHCLGPGCVGIDSCSQNSISFANQSRLLSGDLSIYGTLAVVNRSSVVLSDSTAVLENVMVVESTITFQNSTMSISGTNSIFQIS